MYKELLEKFVTDKNFINFCSMIDSFRLNEKTLTRSEIASLLFNAGVDFIKGDYFIILSVVIEKFLSNPYSFRLSVFHDFFVASLILYEVNEGSSSNTSLDKNISHYIGKMAKCTCNYTPIICIKKIGNALRGYITCKKCGLSVNITLTKMRLYWSSPIACWEVESGIKQLIVFWNQEVDKKEDIIHRTIRELLEYIPYAGNYSEKSQLSDRLKRYVSEKNSKEKNIDILTDYLMECIEPVQWVEDYLWENMPCKISV